MGFMAGTLRLTGRSGWLRERADEADEDSQSSLYYLRRRDHFGVKVGGGNQRHYHAGSLDPNGKLH
jgi:hypothetical protein